MKLIFGCGYLGLRVALAWQAAGETVVCVTRSAARAQEWQTLGLSSLVANVLDPASLANLPPADTVLYAIGYDRRSTASKRQVYVEGLLNTLNHLSKQSQRLVYISSSSVYGQRTGDWVDEDSPCEPVGESGQICLAAEQLLQSHPVWGPRANILRMTGLYGPGRIPHRDKLLAGEPIPVAAAGMLNLIHIDDAAAVVLQAAQRAPAGRHYLVSDNEPVERATYYQHIAEMVGAPPPTFTAPPADSPNAERAMGSKRARNLRLRTELGVELQYPTYREGLQAILQG